MIGWWEISWVTMTKSWFCLYVFLTLWLRLPSDAQFSSLTLLCTRIVCVCVCVVLLLSSKSTLYIFIKSSHGTKKYWHILAVFLWHLSGLLLLSINEILDSCRKGNEDKLKKGHKLFYLTHSDGQITIEPLSVKITLQLPMLEINCLFCQKQFIIK